jgi:tetratricopeptide (TPR) repeat protein
LARKLLALAALCACLISQPAARADQTAGEVPTGADSAADAGSIDKDAGNKEADTQKKDMLHGSAEMHTSKDTQGVAWQGAQLYKQGADALNRNNYRAAADWFHRAADCFQQASEDKFQAQALFAEAQSNRLMGHAHDAAKMYQAAIDLFNEYDPLSPYLKPALDELKKCNPSLAGQVNTNQARLQAIARNDRIMTVDRNIVLKGSLSDTGNSDLLAQKATADIPKDYVDKTMHKAFVRMTCLETTELGSNYITAENRWYPLIANGKTTIISAGQSFMAPVIQITINGIKYNVAVDLPDLGTNKRTVFLLTDGMHIVAIDPATEDMWKLNADFKAKHPSFYWSKLTHYKRKPPKVT